MQLLFYLFSLSQNIQFIIKLCLMKMNISINIHITIIINMIIKLRKIDAILKLVLAGFFFEKYFEIFHAFLS